MKCLVCDHEASLAFNATILKKYAIAYFKCKNCELLFTEKPFWLDEAYSDAIANADTGLIRRSLINSIHVPILLHYMGFSLNKSKFLDYAGGGGVFVRLMRDFGLDFYWNDKFCANWVANGFCGSLRQNYDAITTFESFEHFANPISEIKNLLSCSDTLIFSTELAVTKIPGQDWWYYSLETGQHIVFYSLETLQYISNMFDLNYYNFNNIHILSKRKISGIKQKMIAFLIKKRAINFLAALFIYGYIKIRHRLNSKISPDNLYMLRDSD